MPMLYLKGVSKSFGDHQVLFPTDVEIRQSETTVLLGPSGCGKSTLLRLIVGLLQADTGEIFFDGEKVTPANIIGFRHRMGYMIQDGGLFPHLSVRGNVSLLAKHLKWEKTRIEQRMTELAELTHLPLESLDRFPAQISGGQRQRVALMRALFLDPDVILLDEPMGALDPLIRSELQGELRRIFRSLKKTVVMVTHDIGEAAYLGDVIMLLSAGRIVQRGPFDELLNHPADAFVAEFINAQRSHLQ